MIDTEQVERTYLFRLMRPRFWTVAAICLLLSGPAQALDLSQLDNDAFDLQAAQHLLSRAGFGSRPEERIALQKMGLRRAVRHVVHGPRRRLKEVEFEHSGVFEPGLDPFPPSRPATTALAKRQGHALGVKVKPTGNRPLQPVVDRFFYWLRASRLETDRVAYWWAQRMLASDHPLQEKMALFWHGHFATNEDKVRDYRKMLLQVQLFQRLGLGQYRDLLIATAQDPAMLVFLDAGVNTKDSPNENFAREIIELFTMGVGHYGERDVQEAARAFTGWNVRGLEFYVDSEHHDAQNKTVLGETGPYDGVDVIDLILQQPATAQFIAAKLYRYFVNEELLAADAQQLGELLASYDYDIARFLETVFLSREFYAADNVGTRVKSPVELLVSTYRLLDLDVVPGVPDFNAAGDSLGQRLLHPPTVAGWSQGRSWMTPSLMFERANFVLDVLFPDIGFVPPDRYPSYTAEIVQVQKRLRSGMSVAAATKPTGVNASSAMAASNLLADRDEDFNTRLGSMRGWQMALERVRPIPRDTARVDVGAWVAQAQAHTPAAVIALFEQRFFCVTLEEATRRSLEERLAMELGTADVAAASSYYEEALRKVLHQMLSLPEYQLN